MLLEGHSNLIQSIEHSELNGEYYEILSFFDGPALVVGQNTIALFKTSDSIHDPLGNGLLSIATIPEQARLKHEERPWVIKHQAGFIGLSNQHALLILPNDIRLYSNNQDALANKNPLLTLPLSQA